MPVEGAAHRPCPPLGAAPDRLLGDAGHPLAGRASAIRSAAPPSVPRARLGDTSRWAGRPAEAAEAAAELEFLADEFRTNPRYAPEANPAVSQQLEAARQEMRSFLGVAPGRADRSLSGRACAARRRPCARAAGPGPRRRCPAPLSPTALRRPWDGSPPCRACRVPPRPQARWPRRSTGSNAGADRQQRRQRAAVRCTRWAAQIDCSAEPDTRVPV